MKITRTYFVSIACVALFCTGIVIWHLRLEHLRRHAASQAAVARRAAEGGNAKAETRLAGMYYYGLGVPQSYAQALLWYRKAAAQGYPKAEYNIGAIYDTGQGLSRDYVEAIRWYQKAADQGDPDAECGLGSMYYSGRGTPPSRTLALGWFSKAAGQGLARAQYDLAYMYSHGEGLPQDNLTADRWYQKAADQGYEPAQQALGLRSKGLGAWSAVMLAAMFLGSLSVLRGSAWLKRSTLNRQRLPSASAGIFGLFYVALRCYWAYGGFRSFVALDMFLLIENISLGASLAAAASAFAPRAAKLLFGISGALVIGINVIAVAHHGMAFPDSAIRGGCVVNGFLVGVLMPSAVSLWLGRMESSDETSMPPA